MPRRPPPIRTVEDLLWVAARRLDRAALSYGHGTDNPLDDAAALVFHALAIDHAAAPAAYAWPVTARQSAAALALVDRRIRERVPSAYLTGRTWFAGLEIEVTPDVLVPRSPLAELCERGFAPWVDPARVSRVIDVGTGSGCIAIAAAVALPHAQVDAADVSHAALAVATRNIRRHGLEHRVRPVLSNVYRGIGNRRYDVIVSNPPYVSTAEMAALPDEYRREPALGLAAGRRGLDIVATLLGEADTHLRPGGLLVIEVGDSDRRVAAAWPGVPFTWLEFERGGGGVLLLTAEQVHAHRHALSRPPGTGGRRRQAAARRRAKG